MIFVRKLKRCVFLKVYTFALVRQDRLLILGTAEVEIRVIELIWLGTEQVDDRDNDAEDSKKPKKENSDDAAGEDDQANVGCFPLKQ
uniref:Uncharacterized protein n=1 Tax=Parascaris equorum TaxID=6256 RepID=A0A914RR73_PAREQ